MARLPFIAGNWKMNKTVGEALDLIRELKTAISGGERSGSGSGSSFYGTPCCP